MFTSFWLPKQFVVFGILILTLVLAGTWDGIAANNDRVEIRVHHLTTCLEEASIAVPDHIRSSGENLNAYLFAVCVGAVTRACHDAYEDYDDVWDYGSASNNCHEAEAQAWTALSNAMYQQLEAQFAEYHGEGHHALSALEETRDDWRRYSSPHCLMLMSTWEPGTRIRVELSFECGRDEKAWEAIFLYTRLHGAMRAVEP